MRKVAIKIMATAILEAPGVGAYFTGHRGPGLAIWSALVTIVVLGMWAQEPKGKKPDECGVHENGSKS